MIIKPGDVPPEVIQMRERQERQFQENLNKVYSQRAQIIEQFSKAYLAESGLKPSQVVLVEKHEPGRVTYHFRTKNEVEIEQAKRDEKHFVEHPQEEA